MEALKELVSHGILRTIQRNVAVGNLSVAEGRRLKRLVSQLYQHIYGEYEELEKAGVNEMVEEALILDIDIIEWEHKKELERERERVRKEMEEALILDIDIMEYEHKKELERVRKEMEEKTQKTIEVMSEELRKLGVSEEKIASLAGITKD